MCPPLGLCGECGGNDALRIWMNGRLDGWCSGSIRDAKIGKTAARLSTQSYSPTPPVCRARHRQARSWGSLQVRGNVAAEHAVAVDF